MPTISYPSYGNGGLTIDMWAKLYADADGIINDFHTNGVSALNLTLTGDIARISPGTVQVNGYDMEVTGTTDLSAPAVVATTTYYITALYDPTLNVAAADGSANPLGPVRLTITSGAPASGGGKSWCTQYRITRQPGQALTVATVDDARVWLGRTIVMPDYATSYSGFGPWARGTRLIQTDPNGTGWIQESVRLPVGDGSTLGWVNRNFSDSVPFPAPAALVARFGPAEYFRTGDQMVKARGTLMRSSGANLSTGSDVILGTFPVGHRPKFTERFMCKCGGTAANAAEVRVDPDGVVTMSDPASPCNWIDLSPLHFRAEN